MTRSHIRGQNLVLDVITKPGRAQCNIQIMDIAAQVPRVRWNTIRSLHQPDRERIVAAVDEEFRDEAAMLLEALPDHVISLQEQTASSADEEAETDNLQQDPDPWPDSVSSRDLVAGIADFLSRYVVLPPGAAIACALWVLHAWAYDAWQVSPILGITSPEKRCGKSTLLVLLSVLVPRPLIAANVTAAVVFRTIDRFHPTLLLDEADTFMRDNQELRGVLNSGHMRRVAYVSRLEGEEYETRSFSTWCPKIIAAIGTLPDTLRDRSIDIRMRRQAPSERAKRFRLDHLTDMCETIVRQAARWAGDHVEDLKESDPSIPSELHDRAADCWRPLFAIADMAGEDYGTQARTAAISMASVGIEDVAVGEQLLSDIRNVFHAQADDRITSGNLLRALKELEERPWAEWNKGQGLTASGLAKLLRPFAIRPVSIRVGNTTPKGYHQAAFSDAWDRYLPPLPEGAATAATVLSDNNLVAQRDAISLGRVADVEYANTLWDNTVAAVADQPVNSDPAPQVSEVSSEGNPGSDGLVWTVA